MRLVEIPDDGIVSEYIWAGDSVVGIRRIDLSYLPTIEAEPVRHGRWVHVKTYYDADECNCSLCGQLMTTKTGNRMNYCPNCGCKMDGDSHEPTEN